MGTVSGKLVVTDLPWCRWLACIIMFSLQNEEISHQERLDASRMLIDDLGLKAAESGSLDAGVFSGEEELFAFDRTVSRMTEMQTKDYWKKWKTFMENR